MNTKFKIINAWICQIDGKAVNPMFGDLIVSDGKIIDIQLKSFNEFNFSENPSDANIINANGRVLTLPLVNFHDHFYSRLAKGLSINGPMDNFENILKNLWWKLDLILDEEMIRASAQSAVLDSIRNGVTYIFDHHSSPKSAKGSLGIIADVLTEIGIRGILCFETTDRNGEQLALSGMNENINFMESNLDEDLKGILGLHASFTVSDETLDKANEIVNKLNCGIHIHLCEDKCDVDQSLKMYGLKPMDRLKKYGLLNHKSILAHGIHLKEDDFNILEESGSSVVLNLDSNLNNAVGLQNFSRMSKNIPLLTGTDGMHSNPGQTLRQLFLLTRNNGFTFEQSFALIENIYFRQLDFVKKYFPDFSSLKNGDRADVIIWDYISPTPINKDNFFGHLIYGILERPIHSVVHNGNTLMREFNFTFDDSSYNKNISVQGRKLYNKFNAL
ncbi:MAG: amidohydrolase family protein [Ignavibacteriaceae bacterium]|nr:amidohydrolase family protein [Ignavibacteriaceae bacterium]